MLTDYIVSVIRTVVPTAVGAVLSYIAVHFGIGVDDQASAGLTVFLTGLLISAYYVLVRALEERWPKLGRLLGRAKTPVYVDHG